MHVFTDPRQRVMGAFVQTFVTNRPKLFNINIERVSSTGVIARDGIKSDNYSQIEVNFNNKIAFHNIPLLYFL